jgi:hypothetical protein
MQPREIEGSENWHYACTRCRAFYFRYEGHLLDCECDDHRSRLVAFLGAVPG